MFSRNFSFDPSLSPTLSSTTTMSETRDTSRSVSPCSPTSAFPLPRFSVTDLAAQFADSRLRADSRIMQDSCAAYANMDDDDGWTVPSIEEEEEAAAAALSRSRTLPVLSRGYSPGRRERRQANTRLLCSSAHRRELAALVGGMVERNEQCLVTPPETEDEGYNSASELPSKSRRRQSSIAGARASRPELSCRRGSDMRSSGCCVSKDVRFRKGSEKTSHRRIISSEKS